MERQGRSSLAGLPRCVVTGASSQDGVPEREVGGLLTGAEEKNPVGGEQMVDAAEQSAPCVHGEVKHDIAQHDDVEAVVEAAEGERSSTEIQTKR